ncbi:MAG: LysR family transcriptional regulator, partial [Rhodospirillales bacterium]|nr:LysR family transcriptional regulator [Rhodospirillales bacterium]
MQQIPLTALRSFEAAARTGSFRAAADALHVTPSAISHAIRGLEDSLQTKLFVRDRRRIDLTPQGETLLRHVQQGFEELQRGLGAISGRNRSLLRMHCAPSIAAQWLVPRLPRLLTDCEGLELQISAGVDYTRFQTGAFDADIVYGVGWAEAYARSRHPPIIVLPLGEEEVLPLCTPELAAHIRSPRDLFGQTLIESDNKQVRWPAWFAANDLAAPEPRGPRFDRSFLSICTAADGLGVALES